MSCRQTSCADYYAVSEYDKKEMDFLNVTGATTDNYNVDQHSKDLRKVINSSPHVLQEVENNEKVYVQHYVVPSHLSIDKKNSIRPAIQFARRSPSTLTSHTSWHGILMRIFPLSSNSIELAAHLKDEVYHRPPTLHCSLSKSTVCLQKH